MTVPPEHQLKSQPQLPLLSRLRAGSLVLGLVAFTRSTTWVREWYQYLFPSEPKPTLIKTYPVRSYLPVSIFIPAHTTTATSPPATVPETLPTLFTIHGGGYTLGAPSDDDRWNRAFSNTHNVLVIALNYSKAPYYPYPTAIHDLDALVAAALADSTLPIDPQRCAIAGFSAGGSLALVLPQLDSVKQTFQKHGADGFVAAVSVYPGIDRTVSRDYKATLRQYKPALSPKRNGTTDLLLTMGKLFDWSYVPPGQDLQDPLISPIFASREKLPPHIFMIGAELDMSCYEAWQMACRLAGRTEPAKDKPCGRVEIGAMGELELSDERFAWEDEEQGVRWLLVPDVVHAFDRLPPFMQGDETSVQDAEIKATKVIKEIGDWLKLRVWV